MTTVTLYKNCKVNGTTRLSAFANLNAQKSYFDGLTHKTYTNIQTFKLGEPIRVQDKISNLTNYGYLSIDFGDGFRYYCYVTDFEFITTNQTDIVYTLDAYETAYMQTNMSIGRAHINRADFVDEAYCKKIIPYEPWVKESTLISKFTSGNLSLYYVRRDSEANIIYYGYFPSAPQNLTTNGAWITKILGCLESDIWIAGILPLRLSSIGTWEQKTKTVDDITYTYYESSDGESANHPAVLPYSAGKTLTNNLISYTEFRDMRGTPIYTIRPFKYIDLDTQVTFQVIFTASTIYARGTIKYGTNDREDIILPSELVDVYSDAWKEYYYRQRQSDIDARNQQIANNTVTGIVTSTGGLAAGAGIGLAVGGPVGAVAGAVIGWAVGLLTTAATSGVQSYYGKKEQQTRDQTFKSANDSLVQTGNFTWALEDLGGIYQVSYDGNTLDMYEKDIATDGEYVTGFYPDLGNLTQFKLITAEVEILGDIPNNWKMQIEARISNGVKVV